MKKFTLTAAGVGALAATALGLAGVAGAAATPTYGGSPADTVKDLQAEGYFVQLNGITDGVPLSRCMTTGIDGLQSAPDPTRLNTVYLDFTCPNDI